MPAVLLSKISWLPRKVRVLPLAVIPYAFSCCVKHGCVFVREGFFRRLDRLSHSLLADVLDALSLRTDTDDAHHPLIDVEFVRTATDVIFQFEREPVLLRRILLLPDVIFDKGRNASCDNKQSLVTAIYDYQILPICTGPDIIVCDIT